MSFNSYIFVLLFLPLSVFTYFLLCKHAKINITNIFLLVVSILFYAYAGIKYLILLICNIFVNYLFYLIIKSNRKRLYLILAITFNIAYLLAFKYVNFFISSVNSLFGINVSSINMILPPAISFYTFSQISFIVDAYRGEIDNCTFIEYSLFALYFPKMIQGPIVFFNELNEQFIDENKKKLNWDNIAIGIFTFVIGLSKKVLLADVFGKATDIGFADIAQLDTTNALITMLAYTMQIYFDFSAYSDMAIGISKMFNIELMENFDSPYKALSIKDFWKRWHISLTRFLTKYIYIPLGGNRVSETRTCINTLVVFLISGFWHGSNWTFILWGLFNGIALVVYKKCEKVFEEFGSLFNGTITFAFTNIMWVIFRSNSINEAIDFFLKLMQLRIGGIKYEIAEVFNIKEVMFVEKILFGRNFIGPNHYLLLYFVIGFILLGMKNRKQICKNKKMKIIDIVMTVSLLIICITSLTGVTKYIYQFF